MGSWIFSALSFRFSQSFVGGADCTFGKVAETCWGWDGGKVVLPHPDQVLALALRVETLLLNVPGCQEGTGVEALPRKLDYLLWLDPAAVHKLEALQVDDLRVRAWRVVLVSIRPDSHEQWGHLPGTYQDGRQPPEVQLLGGQPVRLALGAVVELVLPKLLFAGECFQTAVKADRLSLGPARLLHTAVLLHNLQGDRQKTMY